MGSKTDVLQFLNYIIVVVVVTLFIVIAVLFHFHCTSFKYHLLSAIIVC